MVDPDTDLQELLKLAQEISTAGRRALHATVSDLFGEQEEVLTERERALMSDILGKLLHDVEMSLRRDLAERLSGKPDTPHDLTLILANPEIELARPILMESKVLHDPELIEVVQHRTLQHQLATAMRRLGSAEAADALVEAGSTDVIRTLLESKTARISEATMEFLVEESRRVDSYQEPLVRREDLSPALSRRLGLWVAAALRRYLLESLALEPAATEDALQAVVPIFEARPVPEEDQVEAGQRRPGNAAQALAAALAEENQIAPQQLIGVLRDGEVSLFEAIFARMTGLEAPRLQRVIYETSGRGFAIACRAIGIEKPVFASLFLLSRKGRPSEKLTDPQEVAQVMALYDRIDPKAAGVVVRLWQRPWDYQDAIDQV